MGAVAKTGCSDRAYHVDHDLAQDRWDVIDDEGRVVGHSHTSEEAVEFAIREAQHAHGRGEDVVVCVEQNDGTYKLAWSSR
jgi:hypothetical protein